MDRRGLVAAWLAGEAIVIWRVVHKSHHLPVPGDLLGISLLFAGLALVSDLFSQATQVVTLTAWGLDIAAFFDILPAGFGGQINEAAASSERAMAGGQTAQTATTQTGG